MEITEQHLRPAEKMDKVDEIIKALREKDELTKEEFETAQAEIEWYFKGQDRKAAQFRPIFDEAEKAMTEIRLKVRF